MFKKIFFIILLAAGVFAAVLGIKTARFSSLQITKTGTPKLKLPVDSQAIHLLQGALQIPTVSYDNRSNLDTAAFKSMLSYLEKNFPIAYSSMEDTVINNYTPVLRWKGTTNKEKPSILYAHLDVVPVEAVNIKQWQQDPWSGTLSGGYIWGRGALDDKGSMIALLVAAERLIKEGFMPANDIYFIFGHDEEVGGQDGAGRVADYLRKKGVKTRFNLDEGGPCSEGIVPFIDRSVILAGTAEKGYVTLELTAKVKGGHSSKPEKVTSTGILVEALSRLGQYKFPQEVSPVMRDFIRYAGPEMQQPYKIIFANTWLFSPLILKAYEHTSAEGNALTRTTFAITVLNAGIKENLIPGEASAKVNFRILTGSSVEAVVKQVKKVIDDDRININIIRPIEPSPVSATTSYGFRILQEVSAKVFPDAAFSPFLMLGGTDSKHFEDISESLIRCQPVRMNSELLRTIHGVNERIGIHDYMEMIAFYEELIRRN